MILGRALFAAIFLGAATAAPAELQTREQKITWSYCYTCEKSGQCPGRYYMHWGNNKLGTWQVFIPVVHHSILTRFVRVSNKWDTVRTLRSNMMMKNARQTAARSQPPVAMATGRWVIATPVRTSTLVILMSATTNIHATKPTVRLIAIGVGSHTNAMFMQAAMAPELMTSMTWILLSKSKAINGQNNTRRRQESVLRRTGRARIDFLVGNAISFIYAAGTARSVWEKH